MPELHCAESRVGGDPYSIGPFVVLGAFLAVLDLSLVPALANMRSPMTEVVALLAAAALVAQASLVATWGVFSSDAFFTRLKICCLLGVASYFCFAVGAFSAVSDGNQLGSFLAALLAFLAGLPAVFFCLQLPLWAMRVWAGWEIALPGQVSPGSYSRPVMIKDMFLATAAVSVALGLVRMAPAGLAGIDFREFLAAISILFVATTVGSLVALPPLVFLALRPRRLAVALLGTAGWTIVMALLALLPLTVMFGSAPSDSKIVACAGVALAFAGIFSGGLLLTRARGFRLQWRRRTAA